MYCFASRRDYAPPPVLSDAVEQCGEVTIVYPACDGEFLLLEDFDVRLAAIDRHVRSECVISISTKSVPDPRRIQALAGLDQRLRRDQRGFVKVAVSFSSTSWPELEPGAAGFDERVETLRTFNLHGLSTGVTLKPLLPFVDDSDYFRIIDACAPYAAGFVLGDLYVIDDAFADRYLAGRYSMSHRRISWLHEHPVWATIESIQKKETLRKYIRALGRSPFDSDFDLIRDLCGALQYA